MTETITPHTVRYDGGAMIRLCRTADGKYYVWPSGPAGMPTTLLLFAEEALTLETDPGGRVRNNVSELIDWGYLRVLWTSPTMPAWRRARLRKEAVQAVSPQGAARPLGSDSEEEKG